MNNVDRQYLDLLRDVLDNGVKKKDRTGVGTLSVFGRQLRFNMKEGFPLLTTKKIYTKAMFHELLWFLKGGDNIKYLVDNDVRIWNEWPYKKFIEHQQKEYDKFRKENPDVLVDFQETTMEQFVQSIKDDKHYFTGESGFAEKWGGLGPVYGKQWVDWRGINQIDQVIKSLKTDPDSRRIRVSAWNVVDLPNMLLPPCHTDFQFWTKELTAKEREDIYHKRGKIKLVAHMHRESSDVQHDKEVNAHIHEFLDDENVPRRSVSLMFNMRSVDVFLGAPFDIGSYATLLHMIAHCVDMVPDELVITTNDTHIYLNHLEQVKLQLNRSPYNLPFFNFDNGVPKNIYDIEYEHITNALTNYECHPSIKASVAV